MVAKSFRWDGAGGATLTLGVADVAGVRRWTCAVTEGAVALSAVLTEDEAARLRDVPVTGPGRRAVTVPLADGATVSVVPSGAWDARLTLSRGGAEASCDLVAPGLRHALADLLGLARE
jgi:hypothetical protein